VTEDSTRPGALTQGAQKESSVKQFRTTVRTLGGEPYIEEGTGKLRYSDETIEVVTDMGEKAALLLAEHEAERDCSILLVYGVDEVAPPTEGQVKRDRDGAVERLEEHLRSTKFRKYIFRPSGRSSDNDVY
jgi:hypothetical protein